MTRTGDLPPDFSTTSNLVESVFRAGDGSEKAFYRRADSRLPQQVEVSVPVKGLCRRHGFSDASFYTWRDKFGGMTVPDAKRLKNLDLENSRLKKLLAEAHLDIKALKVVAQGKGKPDSATGGGAGDAGANWHLRGQCLSVDRAAPLGVALPPASQRAKHRATSPTSGAGPSSVGTLAIATCTSCCGVLA